MEHFVEFSSLNWCIGKDYALQLLTYDDMVLNSVVPRFPEFYFESENNPGF